MLIWSGWGISVVMISVIGMIVGIWVGEPIANALHLAYGPSQSLAVGIGGALAAAGIFFFAKWRAGAEPGRVFIDEATGQRIEMRPNAGTLFFIPTRYWTWIVLALSAFVAYSLYGSTGPSIGSGG